MRDVYCFRFNGSIFLAAVFRAAGLEVFAVFFFTAGFADFFATFDFAAIRADFFAGFGFAFFFAAFAILSSPFKRVLGCTLAQGLAVAHSDSLA